MACAKVSVVAVCSVLLLVSCGDLPTSPPPIDPPTGGFVPPPPPPPPPQDLGTEWALTAKVTAVAGADTACLDVAFQNFEERILHTYVSGEAIRMVASNNGFQIMADEFEGQIVGREFAVHGAPNPFNSSFRCPDRSTIVQTAQVEVTGRISDNDRELGATMRERWAKAPGGPETIVTWTWTAVRR